jgi:hypothetical protein
VLHSAKGRLGALDKKIKDAYEAREMHEREQVAVVALAERETALSTRERETYSGFLKEDFFTKKDFGRLEQFYTKTWDRLSQGGKDQMSHRIWEGIRRDEYKFSELPPTVREKEMKQLHRRLTESVIGMGEATEIPEKDKKEFIEAYEAGKKDDAAKVLERESFKKTMFRDGEAKGTKSVEVSKHRENESEQLIAAARPAGSDKTVPEKSQSTKAIGNKDFSSLQFGGMTVSESTAPVQSPLAANAGPGNQRER